MSELPLRGNGSSDAESAGDMLRAATARLLDDVLTPDVRSRLESGEFPTALWSAVEDLGLPSALLPEEAGGFGVPTAEALSLLMVAGEYALPLPLADTMLAGFLLAQAGLDVPAGPLAVAPGADVTVDAGGRVSGMAWDVPWGRHIRSIVVLAESGGDPLVLALPRETLTVERRVNMAGDPRDTIRFENVAAARAPAPFEAAELRAAGAATRALMMAGALRAISGMTAQYAQERKQFGRAIGKFQAIQQNLAVLAGQSASALAAAGIAADAMAEWGAGLIPAVAAAKIRAGEAAGIGAAIAHQVHGAIGFTQEHRLQEYTRRLWAWRDEFGGEAEWARELGRHLVAAGPAGLWPSITAF